MEQRSTNSKQRRKAAKKDFSNKPKPAGPTSFIPSNLYVSTCCNALATKKPLVRSKDVKPSDPSSYGEGTKGGWRCTECKKPAKVSRQANSKKESINA